ncbi:MAG: LysR family glycine cleavage system transcriptional activator [Planctomycetota bacterium]|jgi:LysR family glycine cleavage system transcriptional activator
MARKLPPLKALQSFEATARHLSFTAAAEELHVTPAAVGHQVRSLEDYFGQKLLKRSTRQVEMTEQARWVLPVITHGLDLLADAGERLMFVESSPLVNLSVNPGFAARWLVQRLDSFHRQYPEWEVRLAASNKLDDLSERQYDMAIRYGDGNYPGHRVHRLGLEEVSPVCSPLLLEGENGIREPNDLRWHTLLHEDWALSNEQVWPSWRMWLRASGASQVDDKPGPHLSSAALAIQAAIAGQGVALSSTALIADDLKAGRLVRPFGEKFKTTVATGYFLVYLEDVENEAKVIAFRDWLLAEYARAD